MGANPHGYDEKESNRRREIPPHYLLRFRDFFSAGAASGVEFVVAEAFWGICSGSPPARTSSTAAPWASSLRTDPRDGGQPGQRLRSGLGDRHERGVGEDDVCGDGRRPGDGQPPGAQRLERRLVVGRRARVAAAHLALRGGGQLGTAAAAGGRRCASAAPPGAGGTLSGAPRAGPSTGAAGSRNRDGSGRPAAGVRAAPRRAEVAAGAGDPDVEQSALLLDGAVALGQRDGEPVAAAGEEDGVPLEALGRVQRGQRDALDRRGVLGGGSSSRSRTRSATRASG